jgi:glycosyltransferase involved in cell wall biosynthesis
LSWGPNRSAARFLAESVLPELRRSRPGVRLMLVGRAPSADVAALGRLPGVEIAANVPDVRPYLGGSAILAVPLDAGGGTRLKILEAFAAGLPVVSTAVGMEGIAAVPGEHYAGAERSTFAASVLRLLDRPDLSNTLAKAARDLARRHYDWELIGSRAAEIVSELGRRLSDLPASS